MLKAFFLINKISYRQQKEIWSLLIYLVPCLLHVSQRLPPHFSAADMRQDHHDVHWTNRCVSVATVYKWVNQHTKWKTNIKRHGETYKENATCTWSSRCIPPHSVTQEVMKNKTPEMIMSQTEVSKRNWMEHIKGAGYSTWYIIKT